MKSNKENVPPSALQGSLLVASPALLGDTFARSVILLSQHSAEDGAFGLVLNQPTGKVVGDLLPAEMFKPLRHVEVHNGGPVSANNLFFAALWWDEKKGLSITTQIAAEEAVKQIHKPGTLVKAFVGYSGWSAGQLEKELKEQTWIIAPACRKLLGVSHDENLWAGTLRDLSPFHKLLAETPRNPFAN